MAANLLTDAVLTFDALHTTFQNLLKNELQTSKQSRLE
jgi:hypothetical protein